MISHKQLDKYKQELYIEVLLKVGQTCLCTIRMISGMKNSKHHCLNIENTHREKFNIYC